VFVGSRKSGRVYALVDDDGDYVADRKYRIAEDLNMPSGLEFKFGSLYVAALDRILRYNDIENWLDQPPAPDVIIDTLPDKTHHGWKYLEFGPDQMLYYPVGAPCNICDEPGFAEVRRIYADGSGEEVYARGIRNSVGLAFHPATGELWITDNGRDLMGDDMPGDELNHAPRPGLHFGYPYCHQGDTPDPEFGKGKNCADYEPPALTLGAHVAAIGMDFYTGTMFPEQYRGDLFIAQHGSWNRSSKVGYNVLRVRFDAQGQVAGSEVFASGWLQGQENWGRPADVMQLPDGSLLVADDQLGVVYRIVYRGEPSALEMGIYYEEKALAGQPEHLQDAYEWYLKAVEDNSIEARFRLGRMLYAAGREEPGADLLRGAAYCGSQEAADLMRELDIGFGTSAPPCDRYRPYAAISPAESLLSGPAEKN
jgi:glucose/arabinose dehydrogenase